MLHHLSENARLKCRGEFCWGRAGGFLPSICGGAAARRRTHAGRKHNHAQFDLLQLVPHLRAAGLSRLESGSTGFRDLQFVGAVRA
jgi:hypothetical protein